MGFELLPVPLRSQIFEWHIGHTVRSSVLGCVDVPVAAEAEVAPENRRAWEIFPVEAPIPEAEHELAILTRPRKRSSQYLTEAPLYNHMIPEDISRIQI